MYLSYPMEAIKARKKLLLTFSGETIQKMFMTIGKNAL